MVKRSSILKVLFLLLLILILAGVIGYRSALPDRDKTAEWATVQIGDLRIPVEVAESLKQQTSGLSGRVALPEDRGMLFIFPSPSRHNFWMPDMNFPIDIIWINAGRVVDISPNASNVFDSENPVFYTSKIPTRYVLEVNAGFAEKNGIKPGDRVSIFRSDK